MPLMLDIYSKSGKLNISFETEISQRERSRKYMDEMLALEKIVNSG